MHADWTGGKIWRISKVLWRWLFISESMRNINGEMRKIMDKHRANLWA